MTVVTVVRGEWVGKSQVLKWMKSDLGLPNSSISFSEEILDIVFQRFASTSKNLYKIIEVALHLPKYFVN